MEAGAWMEAGALSRSLGETEWMSVCPIMFSQNIIEPTTTCEVLPYNYLKKSVVISL